MCEPDGTICISDVFQFRHGSPQGTGYGREIEVGSLLGKTN